MGQHTWFLKDKDIFNQEQNIYKKLDKYESGEIEYDDTDYLMLQKESMRLWDENKTEFHDCFRTNKRETNGEYCLDIIYSLEECDKWLLDNKELIYYLNLDSIQEFWFKYPNGVIEFG